MEKGEEGRRKGGGGKEGGEGDLHEEDVRGIDHGDFNGRKEIIVTALESQ